MGAGSIHFRKNLAADFLAFFDLWKKQRLQKRHRPRANPKSRNPYFRMNGYNVGNAETGIRERPGPYLIGALAAGYLLQTIPCRTREMDVFMNIPSAYFAGTSPFGFPKESVTWLRPD